MAGLTVTRAGFCNERTIVIITENCFATCFLLIQFSVFGGVASEAVAVRVAGQTVVGTVGASWTFLTLSQKGSQAFVETGGPVSA